MESHVITACKIVRNTFNGKPLHIARVEKWEDNKLNWIAEKSFSNASSARGFIKRWRAKMKKS